MNSQVIDEEGILGGSDIRIQEGEEERSTENSSDKDLNSQDEEGLGEPHVGMEFESEDAAKSYYEAYARRMGFSTRVGQYSRSKPDVREFVCSREGLKRKNADSCNAMLKIEKKDSDKWVVLKFVKEHNHSTVTPSKVHYLRPRRHFAGTAKTVPETYEGVGVSADGVMFMSMDGNRVSVEPNRATRNVTPVEASRPARSTGSTSYARVTPPSSHNSGSNHEDGNRKNPTSASDMTPLLWPRQDEVMRRFNLNDAGIPTLPVADLNLPRMAPVSLHGVDGPPDHSAVLPCLKSMTWIMENKNSTPANRVAVINLKLQDYSKSPSGESEVKFQLSRLTLEPMLRSMAYIGEQLSTPANRVAVINLKLQDAESTSGESEVKFQVSRDTLGAMLRSMAYIREQLSNVGEPQSDPSSKKQRQ
ncbi:Far1-related sequence [Thalictrum thalictroides]|uniref:Far1-related sequence n=1 Tax=Thalictrum thalictroides TaxID=46969 RepID=A0A7J6WB19_THATH|nr:Far1-related sequence [Thalictrum thalictroides]